MPSPSNYNDSGTVFRIDPTTLFQYATVDLPDEVRAIGDSIDTIFNIWQGLQLGWAGTSAAEAQDFSDRIVANLKQLFGTPDDPASGALEKIATAIGMASLNFGETEDVMKKMFDTLTTGLDTPGSKDTPPTRGSDDGPVTIKTPPW